MNKYEKLFDSAISEYEEDQISHSDYRLVDDDGIIGIHEVYYNLDNEIVGIVVEAETLEADDQSQLMMILDLAQLAFKKPVLKLEEF